MKKKRLLKILELISTYEIDTQEKMQSYLSEAGFKVTQATVSRDIKELRLIKITSHKGPSKYALPPDINGNKYQKLNSIFWNSLLNIDFAMNTVVIKCDVGMAQAACAAFESMKFPDIVGSLAGDDTIFILTRSIKSANSLCNSLKKYLAK
ncbi:MAG: hypothetical protein RR540_05950 [Oscillospiraceae bacterium]